MNTEIYTGWKKWTPTLDEWAEFEATNEVPFELKENEYLLVYSNDDKLTTTHVFKDGRLEKIGRSSLKFSIGPAYDEPEQLNEALKKKNKYKQPKQAHLAPINDEQICAFDLLNNDEITCKLLTGNYGSGKTMLAVYYAMQMLCAGKVDKIVWLRNNISAAGTENIGYLPGTEFEKLKPWLGPFIDHLGSEQRVNKLIENGQLEVPALCFIRGRNIENAVVICSEAQNLTEDLIKLILGRIGKNSYIIFDGDFKHQIDKPIFEKSPGLKRLIEKLAGNKLFGYVDLPISERSDTARLADEFD